MASWLGFPLSSDEMAVAHLVVALLERDGRGTPLDNGNRMGELRQALAEAGVWCPGVEADHGGGDAPFELRQIALAAMGRTEPALAWASAQAHAAVELLAAGTTHPPELVELAHRVAAGETAASVVELRARHVAVELVSDTSIRYQVRRLDPAGDSPCVVLVGRDAVWVAAPEAVHVGLTIDRAGMPGAMSSSATVDATVGRDAWRLGAAGVRGVLARLHLGGAAIAAGLAVEAASRSLDYSNRRLQFGGPLTQMPTVRRSLFEQASAAFTALTIAIRTSDENHLAGAMALHQNCEFAITVGLSAIQSLGGYGYLVEYRVEGILRDALSLRSATGASDVRRQAAEHLVGRTAQLGFSAD